VKKDFGGKNVFKSLIKRTPIFFSLTIVVVFRQQIKFLDTFFMTYVIYYGNIAAVANADTRPQPYCIETSNEKLYECKETQMNSLDEMSHTPWQKQKKRN
jgi:hypothetical protein